MKAILAAILIALCAATTFTLPAPKSTRATDHLTIIKYADAWH